jgi:hypothetical protein
MTRGLGGPRVKARLAREGSRRGVLRAGHKNNSGEGRRFRAGKENLQLQGGDNGDVVDPSSKTLKTR